jgi:PAS domain S-box-containing protein
VQDEVRRAIDTLPGLVWSARPDGTVDFLNQRWCDYTGVSQQDGCAWGWLTTVHAEDRAELADYWRSLLAAGEPGEAEVRLRRCDGQFRWFLIRAVPLRDEGGKIVKWYGQNTDIEDRKRAEALLAGEKQLLEMAASGSTLADVLEAVCRLVEKTDPDSHCSILLIDDDGRTVHHIAAPTLPPEFIREIDGQDIAPPYWGPCAMAVARKAQVIVPDIATETKWRTSEWSGLALRHGLRSCWTTPIFSKAGDAFGTFAIYRHEPGAPTARHQELTEQLTHIASIAIEHGRTEAALRESEQRLRLMTNAIPEVIWLTALHPELVLYASPSFERVWGLPLDALYRNPRLWTDTIHEDDRPRVIDTFNRWIRGDGIDEYDIEFRIVQPAGAVRWIHERGVIIVNDDGAPYRVGGISTDITERKQAGDELRRSQAHLAEAQRLSSTGSFTWRVARGEIVWSEQAYRIYEIDANLPVTFDLVFTRIHPDEASWFQELLGRASREGRDLEFEHRLLMPDGSVKYLHVVAHATRDRDDQLEYLGAVQDVTERRRSEDALSKLRSELAHMGRVATLGALTASIAHEVNQPLSGIITNASTSLLMLADHPPNIDGAVESAERTIRDANRASQVIARLRTLFKKTGTARESFDLNEATREVLVLSQRELERVRVTVQTELADDLPTVVGDRVQLQQVVLNLVLNAAEAMSDVHDRPRQLVVRTAVDEGDRILLVVRDTGRGFDPQNQNRLFETFYTTKNDGMGIGLSISRSILERHHGRLWAACNEGPGATFGFSIPRIAPLERPRKTDDPPPHDDLHVGTTKGSA